MTELGAPSDTAFTIAKERLAARPLSEGVDADVVLEAAAYYAQRQLDRRDAIVDEALGHVAARFSGGTESPGEMIKVAAEIATELAMGLNTITAQGDM